MSINNNIWEIAEAYVAGTLTEPNLIELNNRMAADQDFARELQEAAAMIRSLEESGKQIRFRKQLRDIHDSSIAAQQAKGSRRIILTPHFWRTAAVAASVAVLTSTLTYTFLNPSIRKNDYQYTKLSREVADIGKTQKQLNQNQKQLETDLKKLNPPPAAHVRFTGTGFAINNEGYFVTSNHVVEGADSIYIQDRNGGYFKANKLAFDPASDLAILKIAHKNFHFAKGEVPYTFATGKSGLGSGIFTLGYPKNEIVCSSGLISSRNGFDGNELQYTLELPVGHGQSGSPVLDEKGNVIGILTAMGGDAEANTYAVSSQALIDLIHDQLSDSPVHINKSNKLRGLDREHQVEKIEPYTFSVKVYKK